MLQQMQEEEEEEWRRVGSLPGELLLQGGHLRPAELRLLRHLPQALLALQSQASLLLQLEDQLLALEDTNTERPYLLCRDQP